MMRTLKVFLSVIFALLMFLPIVSLTEAATEDPRYEEFREFRWFLTFPKLSEKSMDKDIQDWLDQDPNNNLRVLKEAVRMFGASSHMAFSSKNEQKSYNSVLFFYRSYEPEDSFEDVWKDIGFCPISNEEKLSLEEDAKKFFDEMLATVPEEERNRYTDRERDIIWKYALENVYGMSEDEVSAEFSYFLSSSDGNNTPYTTFVFDKNTRQVSWLYAYRNKMMVVELNKYNHSYSNEIVFEVNLDDLEPISEADMPYEIADDFFDRMLRSTSVFVNEAGWGSYAYIPDINR